MDNDWQQNFAGGMGVGGGLGGLYNQFFGKNPATAGDKYLDQIPGAIGQYYDPYINAGKDSIGALQGQYGGLLNDPGGMQNKFGQDYQQSPGFKFALQQALQGSGHAAAAGGMAGSPQHEQQNMGIATGMANQDYNNWMQNTIGLYGKGLEGEQGFYNGGLQASGAMSDQIANMLAQKGQNAQSAQAAKNKGWGSAFGNLFGGIGSFL